MFCKEFVISNNISLDLKNLIIYNTYPQVTRPHTTGHTCKSELENPYFTELMVELHRLKLGLNPIEIIFCAMVIESIS